MKLRVSKSTISALQRVVVGDTIQGVGKPLGPYRSGPKLVSFFNEFGFNDTYPRAGGFPARAVHAESKLDELNGTERLAPAIESIVDPSWFIDAGLEATTAVEYLNRYLAHDGFELVLAGMKFRLRRRGEALVEVEAELTPQRHARHEFIAEQLEKCDRKLRDGDYDGAITNARSLVEAVLADIESRLDAVPPSHDGDLPKLFKRVQRLLELDPDRPGLTDSLRQILRGLVNIVGGLAPLRNKMGDAHVRTYKPARHHAKLAVNAAKTLVDFVYDTFEYQRSAGRISEVAPASDTRSS